MDFLFIAVAFLLAGFCQIVVGIAMLLSLIPIGPWRRKVIDAVRALTLTLGDSYVLEEDIQRVALADRVRRALEWLAQRLLLSAPPACHVHFLRRPQHTR